MSEKKNDMHTTYLELVICNLELVPILPQDVTTMICKLHVLN